MNSAIKDETIESLRKILLKANFEENYPLTRFTSFKWKQLLSIFENDEIFMQLSDAQILDLCKEVNSRLCKKANLPSAVIKLNKITEDHFRDGDFVHARTKSDASIEISIIDRKDYEKTDKLFRRNIGLDYLSATIQETRRAMQFYHKKRMLQGKSVPKSQVYLGLEYIMRLSIKHDLGSEALLYNDRFLNLSEQDICVYYQDVINEFIKTGNFKDKNRLRLYSSGFLINKYLTVEGLQENAPKHKMENYVYITKLFQLRARGGLGQSFTRTVNSMGYKELKANIDQAHEKMVKTASDYLKNELERVKDDKIYEKHMDLFNELYENGKYFELFTCLDYINEMKIADKEEIKQYEASKQEILQRAGLKRKPKDGQNL